MAHDGVEREPEMSDSEAHSKVRNETADPDAAKVLSDATEVDSSDTHSENADADDEPRSDNEVSTCAQTDELEEASPPEPSNTDSDAEEPRREPLPLNDPIEAEGVVEAILFAADTSLPAARIAQIMGVGDARSVRKQIQALNERYRQQGTSFRIEEIASGFQMLTLSKFNPWLSKLNRSRQDSRLSPAALETLAIIAYREAEDKPVVRAEIEAIRGVSVGEVLNRLLEMNLVRIAGRAEQLGRPMLYGTTKRFLEVFGLASLKDLPSVEELKRPE
jgi:segregation and condensation protein B